MLRGFDERFEELEEEIVELLSVADENSLRAAPGPGRWSAAQCVDHLTTTLCAYLPNMEEAVARGRARGVNGNAPYGRGTFAGRRLVALLEAPAGRGVRAPRVFRPAPAPAAAPEVERSFVAAHSRLRELVHAADGLDLGRLRLASPVSRLLRLSLEQAFRVHVAHEARHRVQAWQALRAAGVAGYDR